jgi:ribonuclease HI
MGASSNVAEYLALIEGMEALLDMKNVREPVEIIGDAKSVIDQMQDLVATISMQIIPLHQRARRLAQQFSSIQWTWKPRRYNRQADILTRHALRQIRTDQAKYLAVIKSINPVNGRSRRTRKFYSLLDLRIYHSPQGIALPAGG